MKELSLIAPKKFVFKVHRLYGVNALNRVLEMDHRRKINKMAVPPLLTSKRQKIPHVTTTDLSFKQDEPVAEDPRLVNWKTWLKRHHVQYQAVGRAKSRHATEMIMNSCEDVRAQIRMKNLMEGVAIAVPDKYRGNPGFWKIPPILSTHDNSCPSEIGPVPMKNDLNLLPTLEYVTVPVCLREEKNLLNSSQKIRVEKRNSYLIKRKRELTDTIAIDQPNTPETINLVALGHGLRHRKEKVTRVPVISIIDTSLENDDSRIKNQESSVNLGAIIALKISDHVTQSGEERVHYFPDGNSGDSMWTLNFFSEVDQMLKKCLHFENMGTVAITYQWRNALSTSKIVSMSSRSCTHFFFNKNKALILPGQKVEFPVWFQAHRGGILSESWRMETYPRMSKGAIIISMRGYVECKVLSSTSVEIEMYLDRCVRNATVRTIIEEIIDNVKSPKPPEPAYKGFYVDRQLFCAKNPSYYYHSSLIAELYRLHAMQSTPDGSPWTLSLIDLRNILLQIDSPDLRHESLTIFSDICQQCLKPSLLNPVQNTKYEIVYNVLCAMTNKIEDESAFFKRICIYMEEDNAEARGTNNVTHSSVELMRDPTLNAKIEYNSKPLMSASNSSLTLIETTSRPTLSDNTGSALYQRVFYTRVYNLLVEAVDQICAVVDSLINLTELEP